MVDYSTIYAGIDIHKNEHFVHIIDPQNSSEMRCIVQNNSKIVAAFYDSHVKKNEQQIEQIAHSETYLKEIMYSDVI